MNSQNTPVHIRLWHHDFWRMAIANLLLTMAVYILVPTLPQWLLLTQEFTLQETGLAMGVFGVGLFTFGAFVSFLIQRYRRNMVCILAVLAMVALFGVIYYVGIESADNTPDKFARAGFHATKSSFVDAPLIDELPMALECKVKSFEDGILIGEIVNVSADESVVTDGKIDPGKLKPITFDPCNNTYIGLGDKVGDAFNCGAALKG